MSTSGISAILYEVRALEVAKILFVTDSGAGPPFARLYLIPKSFFGPVYSASAADSQNIGRKLTSSIVRSSQKNTTGSFTLANDMTGSRCAQDAILADQQLLDTICSTDLGNQLHNLWIPVSSITTNDQEAVLDTLWDRKQNRSDERFAIVWLLENHDFLSQTRAVR